MIAANRLVKALDFIPPRQEEDAYGKFDGWYKNELVSLLFIIEIST